MSENEKRGLEKGELKEDVARDVKKDKKVKKRDPSKTASKRFGKWFRELRSEFKKVVWPGRKQVIKNTAIVLAVIIALGAVIALFDFIFEQGVLAGILKLATGY